MEFHRTNIRFFTILFMFIILFASSSTMQLGSALRPLHAKPHIRNLISHAILQRAPVPPIGGNPCSTIPGEGGICSPPPVTNV
ncbi:hypothetical protein WN944_025934 [Citrus x changshan-huyou]|uniref:Transmembrane protein n=1 Tax=Citrus x changshan-huyou TaxID=2935761 RepID=A0AAP0LTH2_9ROSI